MRAHGFPSASRAVGCLLVAIVLGAAGAEPVAAEPDQRRGAPRGAQPADSPDFWFGAPRGSIHVHAGRLFARNGSDLFDFLFDQFTLEEDAFDAPAFGVGVGVALTPRADARFGVDVSRTSKTSEYRDFVDNDGLPILQDTELTGVDISGSVKLYVTPRGRQISRLAWIPNAVAPYVGGGAGAVWYRFEQRGDFVDFVDLTVFGSRFESSGWAPSAHVFGGADINMWKRLFLALEARYLWADAELGRDFSGFEPIDLSGLRLSVGVNVAF